MRFQTTIWYQDLNLINLEKKFGKEAMENIYFHIAAFDLNKICSLKPDYLDFGPFAQFVTKEFSKLWQELFKNIWAQWRYENGLPEYSGPVIKVSSSTKPLIIDRTTKFRKFLLPCGGGKDSLLSLRLMKVSGLDYETASYSDSIYGAHEKQHLLIERLIKSHSSEILNNRIWIFDDFMDSPVLLLNDKIDIKTLAAGETPFSVFALIPLALAKGFTDLAYGHERSANKGNMIWELTGEDVNHQWGKSKYAEASLSSYVKKNLVDRLNYFSLLGFMHDAAIFNLLSTDLANICFTHSCNIEKPWCKRCPKCAYVWLNYAAYLPEDILKKTIEGNLFDTPENLLWFSQMLGLEEHTPFECIGQVEEARLAFTLCRIKGLKGKAMDLFVKRFPEYDAVSHANEFIRLYTMDSTLPEILSSRLIGKLRAVIKRRRDLVINTLRSPQ